MNIPLEDFPALIKPIIIAIKRLRPCSMADAVAGKQDGEALGVRRRNYVRESALITLSGKSALPGMWGSRRKRTVLHGCLVQCIDINNCQLGTVSISSTTTAIRIVDIKLIIMFNGIWIG